MKPEVTIFWFRRDLRIEDNTALFYALRDEHPVQPIFIFDREILDKLTDKKDARVDFIYREITRLSHELEARGARLDVRYGKPVEVWKALLNEYEVKRLYANKDYEPYARERDKAIYEMLEAQGIRFIAKKDHVIFEKNEVLKKDGKPYTVYSPYSRVWKSLFTADQMKIFASDEINNWHQTSSRSLISLTEMGFAESNLSIPDRKIQEPIIKSYHKTRNLPAINGTTRLSVHLRFGTLSLRSLVRQSEALNQKYLNELIWRDFYQAILWHFPHVVKNNFNRKYDGVQWRNNEEEFNQWCEGKTGYPIVDAGMRELNHTGYMHNRVRMIVSSFLTKHLLIDWRWGEAYFAQKLLDFDLASNNGGWQWAAGTGVDAAPYFRVFNPYLQTEKFDPKLEYVKRYVPEYGTPEYVPPIVDHKLARVRAIETYKEGLSSVVERS